MFSLFHWFLRVISIGLLMTLNKHKFKKNNYKLILLKIIGLLLHFLFSNDHLFLVDALIVSLIFLFDLFEM